MEGGNKVLHAKGFGFRGPDESGLHKSSQVQLTEVDKQNSKLKSCTL